MATWRKKPAEVLDYAMDWSAEAPVGPWLVPGDTVTASDWVPLVNGEPVDWADVDLVKDSDSFADTTTTIWLSGGVLGACYTLRNDITTDQGRTSQKTATVAIKN